jgi:choline kinase
MRVGILAAGVGRRLGDKELPPKILLPFGGRTLLARHAEILRYCGVKRIDLVVGYRAREIDREIARIGAEGLIRTHFNPDYEAGAIVSFATLAEAFDAGEPVVFMDGDVLYDHRMMARLIRSPLPNCFLMDRATEEGEDPVKLCHRDDVLVDFHKRPREAWDWWGEWVGFARFDSVIAPKMVAAAQRIVESGRREAIYEDAIQEVVLGEPPGTFEVEDITGLPWVEIDFPEDLEKAKREILPALVPLPEAEEAPPEWVRQAAP